jgi:hypothetical protein
MNEKCNKDKSEQKISKKGISCNDNNIFQKRRTKKTKQKSAKNFSNKSINRLSRRYSVFDKLASKKYREQAVRDHLKEKEEEEMKECTFKPSINKLSNLICSFKELTMKKQKRGTLTTNEKKIFY